MRFDNHILSICIHIFYKSLGLSREGVLYSHLCGRGIDFLY